MIICYTLRCISSPRIFVTVFKIPAWSEVKWDTSAAVYADNVNLLVGNMHIVRNTQKFELALVKGGLAFCFCYIQKRDTTGSSETSVNICDAMRCDAMLSYLKMK
jgi:hypothetical protein